MNNKEVEILNDKLIHDMKNVFGADQKRIDHTLKVLSYAEQIHREEGGDLMIIKSAAILHDIGIHQAEKKYGSATGKYQEIEGPGIAAEILKKYGIDQESIDKVCLIIANHHSAKDVRINDTIEFKIIWDADWLVNIADEFTDAKAKAIAKKVFKTKKGQQLGASKYL